jgi:hypothetical protein
MPMPHLKQLTLVAKIAFAKFISSSDTDNAISAVIIMDEVVQQDDIGFKSFWIM